MAQPSFVHTLLVLHPPVFATMYMLVGISLGSKSFCWENDGVLACRVWRSTGYNKTFVKRERRHVRNLVILQVWQQKIQFLKCDLKYPDNRQSHSGVIDKLDCPTLSLMHCPFHVVSLLENTLSQVLINMFFLMS